MRSERNGTDVEQDEPVDLAGILAMTEDAADTGDEAVDPTFDLDSSMKSDVDHIGRMEKQETESGNGHGKRKRTWKMEKSCACSVS